MERTWSDGWPAPIEAVARLVVDGALDGAGFEGSWVDYEPTTRLWTLDEVTEWLGYWTGSDRAPADRLVPVGFDGTGGQVMLFLPDARSPWLDAPVVFLGSEGETGVLARDFADFAVLLSLGFGPFDLVGPRGAPPIRVAPAASAPTVSAALRSWVQDWCPERAHVPAGQILADGAAALPGFLDLVESWID